MALSAFESVFTCLVRLDIYLPKSLEGERDLFRILILTVMKYYVQFMQFLGFLALFVHQSKNFIDNGGRLGFSDIIVEHTRTVENIDDDYWET